MQSNRAAPVRRWKRWRLLACGAISTLLVVYLAPWLLRPPAEAYDPAVLAAIKPGMTRHEVETTLGRPLAPQMVRHGIMVRSNRPARSSTPGLIEEEGLDLYFDEGWVLRKSNGWGFVRPESLTERMCRLLGL
jgi:hypothetical protein